MRESDPPPRFKLSLIVSHHYYVESNHNTNHVAVIEENGVRLRLNIVDTPGYGDLVNNDRW